MYERKFLYFVMFVFMLMAFSSCGTKEVADSESKKIDIYTEKPSDTPALKEKNEVWEVMLKNVSEGCISVETLGKMPQAEPVSPKPAAESQIPAETEEPIIQEPQIKELNLTMYAAKDLNVRAGDNKNTSLMGSLVWGQEVLVTGQSNSTGWYRIDYNGQAGFVSNKYLQNDKPVQQPDEQSNDAKDSGQTSQAKQPTVRSGSVRQILNSAPLNPSLSGYEPLDTLLSDLLPQLYSDNADTYDKVKACYDYLIQNCSYGTNERMFDNIEDFFLGYYQELSAYGMLLGHVGVCGDYSTAFTAMVKRIGLDCRVVGGQTAKSGGGYTEHAWCVITINGTEYVFDAQVEDNISKGGAIQYYRFCKTYDEVPGKYII